MGFESRGHGVRGLSDGDDEDAIVGIEIVQIVADAQNAALTVHVAGEGVFDGGILQRCGEDLTGGVAHAAELLIALGRYREHGRDYMVVSRWLLVVGRSLFVVPSVGGRQSLVVAEGKVSRSQSSIATRISLSLPSKK